VSGVNPVGARLLQRTPEAAAAGDGGMTATFTGHSQSGF
jgi:hypothetical protein